MSRVALSFVISGRIDGRIRRLAAESELDYAEVLQRLVSGERVGLLAARGPVLAGWGINDSGPWRRTVHVTMRVDEALHQRIAAIAEDRGASMSDVARYLVTGGRTTAELDADSRSREPLDP